MRAALYRSPGPARAVLAVEDVPDPSPGPGEVRVRIHVSGVNPTDVKARSGSRALSWPYKIPNQDGAGVIDAVGAGVTERRPGERVWVFHAAYGRSEGTAAEYVCVPANQAVTLPDELSFARGAALGIPFMTAAYCLDVAGPLAGRRVLVTGGAGAVGNAAIQLARRAGAVTIATVSSQDKARLARTAGADVVLDYRSPNHGEELAAAAPEGIDHVVDVAFEANIGAYASTLAPRAHVASYASSPAPSIELPLKLLRERNVTLTMMLIYEIGSHDLDRAVEHVAAAAGEGALQALPEHHFPLAEIAAAHEAVERGTVGRVLVDLVP